MRKPSFTASIAVCSITLWTCGWERAADGTDRGRAAISAAGSKERETLVVDDDKADCPEADFTSIQAAVAAAAPGAKIIVCAGTYREQVKVEKNGLAILADADEERGQVVVDAHGHDFGFLVLNASGVTIEGFLVKHAHEADIFLDHATSTSVRKNVTTAAGHDGIELFASHDNLIEENVAVDNLAPTACGINVTGGSTRNVVRQNVLVNNEWGIQIVGASTLDNAILENKALRNRGNGIRNIGGASGTVEG